MGETHRQAESRAAAEAPERGRGLTRDTTRRAETVAAFHPRLPPSTDLQANFASLFLLDQLITGK